MGTPYQDTMPFSICDVLNALQLPIKKEKGRTLILDCPFCLGKDNRPDHHGHMEVDLSRDRFRCHRCGRMGGKLDLYMEGRPGVLDTKQAYREMAEFVGRPVSSRPAPSPRCMVVRDPIPTVESGNQPPAEQVHKTFSTLIGMLTLTSTHRQNLRERGLSDEEIDRLQYRSVPAVGTRKLAAKLLEKDCVLEGVPGFYLDDEDRWTLFTGQSGILMPERDREGCIHGLQVRKDNAKKHKCYWLTGAERKQGVSHRCILHIANPKAAVETGAAYLTEGIMKADIAAFLSGRCFLAVPGVSHYSAVGKAVPGLKEMGVKTIFMAFDMDMYENPAVKECFEKIRSILTEAGFEVKQITWNRHFKGIDDYLKDQTEKRVDNE